MGSPDLSIVIPLKGGVKKLHPELLGELAREMTKADVTYETLIREEEGYGVAVKAGLEASRGAYVTIMAADGSDSPAGLVKMYKAARLNGWSVYGRRVSWEGYPQTKLRVNRLANEVIAFCLGESYADWTNPFKVYRRADLLRALPRCKARGMSFGMELALRNRNWFVEAPIGWRAGVGESAFKWYTCWDYLKTVWRVLVWDR